MKHKIIGKNGIQIVALNRRKAIHEKCLNCSCWIPSQVKNCSLKDCPLYLFRTGKGKQNSNDRFQAIRKFCIACTNSQLAAINNCPSLNCPLFVYRKGSKEKSKLLNNRL